MDERSRAQPYSLPIRTSSGLLGSEEAINENIQLTIYSKRTRQLFDGFFNENDKMRRILSSMKHELLLTNAFRKINLSVETHPDFFNSWEEVEYDRSDFITSSGKIERYFYVVVSGVQTIYILTKEGDKQVIGFSFDGSFSGVYDSFLMEKPSHYFLEALTPTKLIRMNKQQYDKLFELYPEFDRWGRLIHQDLLVGRVQREIELITLSAKERYQIFMNRCPNQLRTIPQKYLASYLNMTPETFSRLRKEKS